MIDLLFDNFSICILIITILIFVAFYFIYRSNFSDIFNYKVLFSINFLFFAYWIPQGFDITDEGFILSKSWFLLHGTNAENVDMTVGSSFFNGIWLSIFGEPNILWARLGFALIYTSISVLSFKILTYFFEKKTSFFSVLIITVLIPYGHTQLINYQNLPIFFVLLSFLFFVKAQKKNKNSHYFLSGIFMVFAVISKFPLFIFFIYQLIYFIYEIFKKKRPVNNILKSTFYSYLGVLIGVITFIGVLFVTDSLSDYYSNVFNKFNNLEETNPRHSLPYLLGIYFNDLKLILIRALLSLGFIFLFLTATNKINKFIYRIPLIVLFAFGLIYFTVKISVYHNWMYTVMGFELAALILFAVFNFRNLKQYLLIIFLSVFMFFSSFIGSNMGFRMHIWSGAGLFFGPVFLALMYNTKFSFKRIEFNFKKILPVFILFLLLLTYKIKPYYIYRDRPRKILTESFKSKELSGIKSNSKRVEVVDSLILYMNSNLKAEDTIVVVGAMPMIYYLTDKNYIFKDLWRHPSYEFQKYIEKQEFPDWFIFSKINPRNPHWPVKNQPLFEKDSVNYLYYMDIVKQRKFDLNYENSMFMIFRKQSD